MKTKNNIRLQFYTMSDKKRHLFFCHQILQKQRCFDTGTRIVETVKHFKKLHLLD